MLQQRYHTVLRVQDRFKQVAACVVLNVQYVHVASCARLHTVARASIVPKGKESVRSTSAEVGPRKVFRR